MTTLTLIQESLKIEEPASDFSQAAQSLRLFDHVPKGCEVIALRGFVLIFEPCPVSAATVDEGAFYVRENQSPAHGMPLELWLRSEMGDVHLRSQPNCNLKVRREVVQAVRNVRDNPGSQWGVRLECGHVDGPYFDWAFGCNLVGRILGIYSPAGR